jgi:hypothetical protein
LWQIKFATRLSQELARLSSSRRERETRLPDNPHQRLLPRGTPSRSPPSPDLIRPSVARCPCGRAAAAGAVLPAAKHPDFVERRLSIAQSSDTNAAATEKTGTAAAKDIIFHSNGSLTSNCAQIFGHEEMYAAYEWPSAADHGWDREGPNSKELQKEHQAI